MEINIRPQTIISVIAASESESSRFIEYLIPNLLKQTVDSGKTVVRIKDTTADKISSYRNLGNFCDDFIVVENFTPTLPEIAENANYELVLVILNTETSKAFRRSISTLQKELNKVYIKDKNFNNLKINIEELGYYSKHFIFHEENYAVIGDPHGCIEELKEAIQLAGDSRIIFVGDFIDKGPNVREVIEFLYERRDKNDIIIRGNHERFVYNYLKGLEFKENATQEILEKYYEGIMPSDPIRLKYFDNKLSRKLNKNENNYLLTEDSVIQHYFSTTYMLLDDPELREKFNYLYEKSLWFVSHPKFFVTHAPSEEQYLGKFTSKSLGQQCNFRYSRHEEDKTIQEYSAQVENDLAFFKNEANIENRLHIVGHVMTKNVVQIKNKFMIDTGCVAGGGLTILFIDKSGQTSFKTVRSKQPIKKELPEIFYHERCV